MKICFIYNIYGVDHSRFVDRDMLMHFHFGLGVGHVYSHKRTLQTESPHRGVVGQDDSEVNENYEEDEEEDSSSEEEDGYLRAQDVVLPFGFSNESFISQFDEMYGSEVELDYEN